MIPNNILLENKTIFITGIAGFIGSYLALELLKKWPTINIVGIDSITDYYDISLKEERLKYLEKYKNFHFIKGNIANKELITEINECPHVPKLAKFKPPRCPIGVYWNTLCLMRDVWTIKTYMI